MLFGEQTTDAMSPCFVTLAYDHPEVRIVSKALRAEGPEPARPRESSR